MAANSRNYQRREADRRSMNELALAGVPQAEIAGQFGVSQPQVAYDLRVVRERWNQTTSMNLEAARDRELALHDKIEEEAWEGLARAKLRGDGGEVRFLVILLKASEQRASLLGLPDNPPKPTLPANDIGRQQRFAAIRSAFAAKVLRDYFQASGQRTVPPDGETLPSPTVPVVSLVTVERPTQGYKMS